MKRSLRGPSPALIVSLVALFVALGGTSLAAANFINGRQIKPHSLPKDRLTQNAIKSLRGARGLQGPKGSQGIQGIKGDKGDPGPTAASYAYGYLVQGPFTDYTTVLALSDTNDAYGPGKLTVGFASRILVEANITMDTTTVSANAGACLLELSDSNGNTSQISQDALFSQSALGYTDVHVTGAADEPAGTYDILLQCKADGSKSGESYLTAIAAAQG
jgi:hypothetical protein